MAICYVPSTTNKASNIKLKDTNDNYTSNDVEGALEEVDAQFKDISKDISGLASKDELHEHTNKAILDSITQDKINLWDNGGNSEDNSTIPKLSTICVKDESGNSLLTLDFDLMPKDKATVYLNDVFTSVQGNGILKIRRDGVDHSLGILSTDYMFVTIGYKTSNNTLLITNTRNATEFDFNTNTRTSNGLSCLNGKAGTSTVLTKTNTTEYTPTSDYNPSTKKYVDDAITGVSTHEHTNKDILDAITQENMLTNTVVTDTMTNNILKLTTDRIQFVDMENVADSVEIELPIEVTENRYTEIRLYFKTTNSLTLSFPNIIAWQPYPIIRANKFYEIILIHINDAIGWLGKYIEYGQME